MRTLRNRLMAALSLSIFLMVFPNHTLLQTTQPNLRIRAQSVILMDAISGQILYEQTPQLKIAPASFVKILTLVPKGSPFFWLLIGGGILGLLLVVLIVFLRMYQSHRKRFR